MPTTIHTGLRAHATDALALADTIRERLAAVASAAKQAQYGDDLTRVWDLALQGVLEGSPLSPTSTTAVAAVIYRIEQNRADEDAPGASTPVDWEAAILPDDSSHLLLLMTTSHEAYWEALRGTPGIEEYGYWDDSERPEYVTAADWGDRHKRWERALGPDWSPSQHGVIVQQPSQGRVVLREHHDDAWLHGALDAQPHVRARLTSLLTARAAQAVHPDDLPYALPVIAMDIATALQEAQDNLVERIAPGLHPLTLGEARGTLPSPEDPLAPSAAQDFLRELHLEAA